MVILLVAGMLLIGLAVFYLSSGPETLDTRSTADSMPHAEYARPVSSSVAGAEDIRRVAAEAFDFLVARQSDAGSWPSFSSPDPTFRTAAAPASAVYPTMTILVAFRHTEAAGHTAAARARPYLLDAMYPNEHVWSYAGRHGEFLPGFEVIRCYVDADTDDTALGWVLLGASFDNRARQSIHASYERYRTPSGAFRTYMIGMLHGDQSCGADYGNAPSLGVNLNILSMFTVFGFETDALVRGIESMMVGERYWDRAIYGRHLPYLAYLASNAVEEGSNAARRLLARLLADFASSAEQGEPGQLDTMQLAAFVKARTHLLMLESGDARELDPFVRELIARREADGGFEAAPTYEANGRYYGSRSETTAVAYKALHLRARLGGAQGPRSQGKSLTPEGSAGERE